MKRKLMVVAHPDDELIFGGAHLLQEKQWKVICITNGSNRRRRREFEKAMRFVGADYEIWNYRDTYSYKFDIVRLNKDLRRLIRQNQFEKVVTHNLRGEYGHPQHRVIARLMRRIVPHQLYVFSISKKKLPGSVRRKKQKLLRLYQSQRMTIWELCRDDELAKFIDRECFVRVKK